jgi:thiosulfate/3-mercaptopyruvate sulfurtransferase
MSYTTLVNTQTLANHLDDPSWVKLDCRFSLGDPGAGRRAYTIEHIPGARYAHLDEDLSSPVSETTGRHPLPSPNTLAEKLGCWGVDRSKQLIVYDDAGGAIAGRLWWLLRWLGHESVAVLDGDFRKWRREARPMISDESPLETKAFHPGINPDLWVDTAEIERIVAGEEGKIIDARSEERFAGAVEPLDKAAGHIPGAINVPFLGNLRTDGQFLSAAELRARFENYLKGVAPAQVVQMCGSGVTACHNLLAMEHAGLSGARLYPGSWSEWINDPEHPVARGTNA